MDTLVDVLLAITSAATTLVAAYYGAKLAFDLQSKQQDKSRAEDDVRNANIAILNLLATHHHLTQYRKHFVEPRIDAPDRHFSILPVLATLPRLPIDLDKLSFLLKTSDPRVIHGLSLSAIDVNITIELIATRSQFHANELQPRMEAVESKLLSVNTLSEKEELLGQRITTTMRHLTDSVIEYLDHSLPVIELTIQKLHTATKEVYPDHLVAKMTSPDSKGQT